MQKSSNQEATIEPQLHLYKGYYWNILRLPKRVFFKRFFFNVDLFFSLYGICYNTASVLCFGFSATRHMGS